MLRYPGGLLLVGMLALPGCQRTVTLMSNPLGARVMVDGDDFGTTPVNYRFDFGEKKSFSVVARKTGYHDLQREITEKTAGITEGMVVLELEMDERWSATATTQATNRWLRIPINSEFTQEQMWQRLIDSITGYYLSLEQLDSVSGYVRSAPSEQAFRDAQHDDTVVRTQLVGALASRDPLVYKVKIVAEQNTPSGRWQPFGRVFKADAELLEELMNRLGPK